MSTTQPRPRPFVICGDDALAYRLVHDLVTEYGAEVTVVLPSRVRDQGPRLGRLPGVRLIEAGQLDDASLRAAGVADAQALALVGQDDVGNVHAALRAHDLNPDLRLVMRMFNMSLAFRIRTLFADCAVLSDSAIAAPSFVAAALGEVAPSFVRLPGRTLYVARGWDVPATRVVCGLADTTGGTNRLLPAADEKADLVLAVATGPVAGPRYAYRRNRTLGRVRLLLGHSLVRLVLTLVGLIVLGMVLMVTVGHVGIGSAIYQGVLDAAGDAVPDPTLTPFDKVVQLTVTLSGLALVPMATAAVVDGVVRARLSGAQFDHVVVVGLGNVGMRVVAQLHDLGVSVTCVDIDENARGVQLARRLGVPVVFGDATTEDTLRAASVGRASALLVLTDNDVANLEVAVHGRSLREDLRVVLRMFDDDLAERVERSIGFGVSRSVSRLAASAFAAAMMRRQVIGTISVGRAVLMIAEVPLVAGAPLTGQPIGAANEPGQARVIAVWHHDGNDLDWAPDSTEVLTPLDRLIVVATQAGLGHLLARTMAPVPQQDVS